MFCAGVRESFSNINHYVYWVFVGNSELISEEF
ncbi:hypothetical protein SAMN03080594_101777 [Arenibacter palladensis]|uniref:Uncharacterized protein n=1 Tax=Arenibacter palladensis TaxID=237373 RepID=A0A1M4UY33_9FLAO|nr:hypothetical protein SAMN03080594_101777 [Arenibacter palladensis]